MAQYRITVEKSDADGDILETQWEKRAIVTVTTKYLLEQDVPEWLRDEIDGDADIVDFDDLYGTTCCKTCGHPFSDHSFYGATRSECHSETPEAENQCECGYYEAR